MMKLYPHQQNLPANALRELPSSSSPVLSWAYGPQETVSAADIVTVTSPGGSKLSLGLPAGSMLGFVFPWSPWWY